MSEPRPGSDGKDQRPPESPKLLFEQARQMYQAGDLKAALELMQRCYEVSRRPELLFNLGELNRELDRCLPALEYYRQYRQALPKGRRQADAARRIEELERRCGPIPEDDRPPERTRALQQGPREKFWPTAAWATIAAGAACSGASLYLALLASSKRDQIERLAAKAASEHRTWSEVAGPQREEELARASAWARVLAVAAGGLVAGGVTILVMDPGSGASSSLAVLPSPGALLVTHGQKF